MEINFLHLVCCTAINGVFFFFFGESVLAMASWKIYSDYPLEITLSGTDVKEHKNTKWNRKL